MWDVAMNWVVALAGLALGAVGIWLTVHYGQRSQVSLHRISRQLDVESDNKP